MSRLYRHQDCDGEGVEDLAVLTTSGQIEGVVVNRLDKHLAHAVGITFVGEGAAEQVFELASQTARLHPWGAQIGLEKQTAKLFQGHAADMRRVTQAFFSVQGIRLFRCGSHIGHQYPSAYLANALHLPERSQRIEQMMKGKTGSDDGKMQIGVGQRHDVALLPGDVTQPLLRLRFSRLLQHGRRQVNANRVTDYTGKGAGQQAGPAGDVKRCIVRAGFGQFDDLFERLLVADGLGFGKWRRLAGELVEDAVAMGTHNRMLLEGMPRGAKRLGKNGLTGGSRDSALWSCQRVVRQIKEKVAREMRKTVLFLLGLLFMGSTATVAQQSLGDVARQTRAQKNRDTWVIHREPPVYPQEAKAKGISGSVIVEAVVDRQGNVSSARFIEGDQIFKDAALAAVKAWKFQPPTSQGQPAERTTQIKMRFEP